MTIIRLSTMRFFGVLALISAFLIAPAKSAMPSETFYYAIMTADIMVIAFWILDEFNNLTPRKNQAVNKRQTKRGNE